MPRRAAKGGRIRLRARRSVHRGEASEVHIVSNGFDVHYRKIPLQGSHQGPQGEGLATHGRQDDLRPSNLREDAPAGVVDMQDRPV
jgi:hypothetical protein